MKFLKIKQLLPISRDTARRGAEEQREKQNKRGNSISKMLKAMLEASSLLVTGNGRLTIPELRRAPYAGGTQNPTVVKVQQAKRKSKALERSRALVSLGTYSASNG